MAASALSKNQGYQPNVFYDGPMLKKVRIAANTQNSMEQILQLYGRGLPTWWPRHNDGEIVTHLYRLIDERRGTDLIYSVKAAMSQMCPEDELVDFSHPDVIRQALMHVSPASEGDLQERPFLSMSLDMDAVLNFGHNKMQHDNAWGLDPDKIFVRFDFIAYYFDSEDKGFGKKNFCEIWSKTTFDAYFRGGPEHGGWHKALNAKWLDDNNVNYEREQAFAARLKEVLVGTRGAWWPKYSLLVDETDRVLDTQTYEIRGYGPVNYGDRLAEIFSRYDLKPDFIPPKPSRPVGIFEDDKIQAVSEASSSRAPGLGYEPGAAAPSTNNDRYLPRGTFGAAQHHLDASSAMSQTASQSPEPAVLEQPDIVFGSFQPAVTPAPTEPPAVMDVREKKQQEGPPPDARSPPEQPGSSTPSAMSQQQPLPPTPAVTESTTTLSQTSVLSSEPGSTSVSENTLLNALPASPLPDPAQTATPTPSESAPTAHTPTRENAGTTPYALPQSTDLPSPEAGTSALASLGPSFATFYPMESHQPAMSQSAAKVEGAPRGLPLQHSEIQEGGQDDFIPEWDGDDPREVQQLKELEAMEQNINKGADLDLFSQEQVESAMSQDNPGDRVAEIINRTYLDYARTRMNNCSEIPILSQQTGAPAPLSPFRLYNDRKRHAAAMMQEDGFSQEVIDRAAVLSEDYLTEVCLLREAREKLFNQWLFIADVSADADPVQSAEAIKWYRLMQLDVSIVGFKAKKIIEEQYALANTAMSQGTGGLAPVQLDGTFAQLLEQQGWIMIAAHQREAETLSTNTPNFVQNYPPIEQRTLPALAHKFGFYDIQQQDTRGKNILHHLFTAMKYSDLACGILHNAFGRKDAKLPGNYTAAMSQKVHTGTPNGWSPLHILCSGSDKMVAQSTIIEILLKSGICTIRMFDSEIKNDGEIVFYSLSAMLPGSL